MKRTAPSLVLIVALTMVAPSLVRAQSQECSPKGTWYGGAPTTSKYVLTIVPLSGNTYSLSWEGAYSLESFGYVRETTWHGKMVKVGKSSYRFRAMELLVWGDTDVPPAESALETDIVEGIIEFNACDDMTYTIDLFAYYVGWGHEPFVDEPDGYLLPPGEVTVGTMRRMVMY